MHRKSWIFLSLCLALPASAVGQTPLDNDTRFVDELNKIQLFDYSELFLQKKLKTESNTDAYRIALMQTYVKWNKMNDAKVIIDAFDQTSPMYYDAQIALGIAAFQKNDIRTAEPAFMKVLTYCESFKEPDRREKAVIKYELGLQYLQQIYKNLGKADAVKRVSDVLNVKMPPRQATLNSIMAALETADKIQTEETPESRAKSYGSFLGQNITVAEANKARGEILINYDKLSYGKGGGDANAKQKVAFVEQRDNKSWSSIAARSAIELQKLLWGGEDMLSAYAYALRIRCFAMFGNIEAVEKEYKQGQALMFAFDEELEKEGKLAESPAGLAVYWRGVAYFNAMNNTDDKKLQRKYSIEAFKTFGRYLTKYTTAREVQKAYPKFLKTCDKLAELAPDLAKQLEEQKARITAPKQDEPETLITKQMEQVFKNKRWDDVVTEGLKIFYPNRGDERVAEIVRMLTIAEMERGNTLEAMMWCSYLHYYFPRNANTPAAYIKVSETCWKKGDKANKDDALFIYSYLLNDVKDYQYAGEIAARVTREYYNRAHDFALEANKSVGDEKAEKIEQARNMYRAAVPHGEFVIKNYSNRKDLTDGIYFLMGDCYNSADDYLKASNMFVAYCESDPKDKTKIATARLNAANCIYSAATAAVKESMAMKEAAYTLPDEDAKNKKLEAAKAKDAEARDLFAKGLVQMNYLINPEGAILANKGDASVQRNIEDAVRMLPYFYDGSGKKQEAADAFVKFMKEYPKNKYIPGAMMRLGVLYTEINETNKAQAVLDDLAKRYPDSPEGKNALYYLARTLYTNNNFEKCLENLKKIFGSAELTKNLSISNLRWIASNVANCGGQHPKDAAETALKATNILLADLDPKKAIKQSDLAEWIGPEEAAKMVKPENKKLFDETMLIIREKVLSDGAHAAYYSEDYKKAADFATELLEGRKEGEAPTPYYYETMFTRADAYFKLNKMEMGYHDLAEVSMRATTSQMFSLYYKAQALLGEAFIKAGNTEKAFNAFFIVASPAYLTTEEEYLAQAKSAAERERMSADLKASHEWLERAIRGAAVTAKKLNKTSDMQNMKAKYKKQFPDGAFIKEINAL